MLTLTCCYLLKLNVGIAVLLNIFARYAYINRFKHMLCFSKKYCEGGLYNKDTTRKEKESITINKGVRAGVEQFFKTCLNTI